MTILAVISVAVRIGSERVHHCFTTPSVFTTEGVSFYAIPLENQSDTKQSISSLIKVRQVTKTPFLNRNGGEMVVTFGHFMPSAFLRGHFYLLGMMF